VLSFRPTSAITRPSRRPAEKGCRGSENSSIRANLPLEGVKRPRGPFFAHFGRTKESKMPKLKTKSGAKKRFKVTATGKVMAAHAGKRHGMIKRTKKQIRQLRGTTVLFKTDGDNIKKYWLPNH
jgi:large subunit ribosomal protein L35